MAASIEPGRRLRPCGQRRGRVLLEPDHRRERLGPADTSGRVDRADAILMVAAQLLGRPHDSRRGVLLAEHIAVRKRQAGALARTILWEQLVEVAALLKPHGGR